MGKRSDFEKLPRSRYITPLSALLPLLPHLPDNTRFLEPCAAGFQLAEKLEEVGHECVDAWDIEPDHCRVEERNALIPLPVNLGAIDMIITNPPWDRDLLHPMIANFATRRPTWLLFDSDWVYTTQEAMAKKHSLPSTLDLWPLLREVVPIGRVKWIEGSPHAGKDNCAWYLFGPGSAPPIFHPPLSRSDKKRLLDDYKILADRAGEGDEEEVGNA
jgi:hypothetical protein